MSDLQLTVDVTEHDIRMGNCRHAESCAIAWAILDIVDDLYPVVDIDVIQLRDPIFGNKRYECETPKEVVTFIELYDDGKPVKPERFVLDFYEVPA